MHEPGARGGCGRAGPTAIGPCSSRSIPSLRHRAMASLFGDLPAEARRASPPAAQAAEDAPPAKRARAEEPAGAFTAAPAASLPALTRRAQSRLHAPRPRGLATT